METVSPTILIVDDEAMIRSLLMDVLNDYRCMAFPSGVAAIEWVEKHPGVPVELVISDFDLPGGNGVKSCLNIRRLIPGVKVILMSGTSIEDIETLAQKNHFDGWARKPFSLKEMLLKVSDVLKAPQVKA